MDDDLSEFGLHDQSSLRDRYDNLSEFDIEEGGYDPRKDFTSLGLDDAEIARRLQVEESNPNVSFIPHERKSRDDSKLEANWNKQYEDASRRGFQERNNALTNQNQQLQYELQRERNKQKNTVLYTPQRQQDIYYYWVDRIPSYIHDSRRDYLSHVIRELINNAYLYSWPTYEMERKIKELLGQEEKPILEQKKAPKKPKKKTSRKKKASKKTSRKKKASKKK
jgi:hypothetical protein